MSYTGQKRLAPASTLFRQFPYSGSLLWSKRQPICTPDRLAIIEHTPRVPGKFLRANSLISRIRR
jgi:hypothetical protein